MLSQQQLPIRNIDVKTYKLERNLIKDTKKKLYRDFLKEAGKNKVCVSLIATPLWVDFSFKILHCLLSCLC